MIGGVVTSALLELLIYPVIFIIWKEKKLSVSDAAWVSIDLKRDIEGL